MTLSLTLACLWLFVANVIAMFPSRDKHWRAAYGLIAIGLPLLGFVIYENGLVWGGVVLAAGAWILRWPVRYLGRWLRRKLLGATDNDVG